MKRRKYFPYIAAAAALLLAAPAGLRGATAYFTTYVSAGGSGVLNLGAETELVEDVSNMTKHISVKNTSQTNDCFVRVKVFCGSQLTVSYEDSSEGENLWYSGEDGYWYYRMPLGPGEATEILDVKINDLPESFDRDSFNVVVIQECTPVVYDEDGSPSADWELVYQDYQETGEPGEGALGQ